MKKKITILSLILLSVKSYAQNYEPILVDSNISFYEGFTGDINGIKIISSSIIGNAKVYELSKSWNISNFLCIKPNGKSWLGEKFAVVNNQYLFFNKEGDTIFYHPNTELGTTWRLYTYKNQSYIEAKIERKSRQLLLNVFDSFVEYSFKVFNKDGISIPHNYNSANLRVSKNYGAIGIIPAYDFPNTIQFVNLCGVTKFGLGYNFLSWRKIFDLNIGDEFHLDEINFSNSLFDYQSKTIKKIIDKKVSTSIDSIFIYTIDRLTYFDYYSNDKKDYLLHDTITETFLVKNEPVFVMDEPIFDTTFNESGGAIVRWNNGPRKFVRYFNTSLYKKNNDSCWYIYNPTQSSRSSFMEGCGLLKFEDSNNGPASKYEKNLVYYKKGNETWGLPFENLSLKNIDKPLISIYPNPIKRNENLVVKAPIYLSKIEVLNMIGEVILTVNNINKTEETIDIDLLKSGTYIIRLTSSNIVIYNKLLSIR
jgi:hypothetical protein